MILFTKAATLHDLLTAAAVPVVTVRQVGGQLEPVYADSATPEQIAEGDAIVAAFDSSDAAEQARQDAKQPEKTTLRNRAAEAVSDNNTFMALVSPTNAQTLAQVKRLTEQNTAIIRRLVQLSEAAGS